MTVLIVEDDPIQQNALKILLTEYNPAYDLLCASSYAEGLDLLSHSDISLFLLDVELNPCDRTDTKDGGTRQTDPSAPGIPPHADHFPYLHPGTDPGGFESDALL